MQKDRDWIIHLVLFSLIFFSVVFGLSSELRTLLMVILIAAVVLGAVAIHYYHAWSKSHQDLIRQEIKQLGGRGITVYKEFAERDTNICTYFVKFVGPSGKRFQTKCVIRPNDSKLYWRQSPIELLRGTNQNGNIGGSLDNVQQIPSMDNGGDFGQRSRKEILLDKLTSEFRHERIEAITHIAEMSQVDELVIHRVQEMAVSDSDPLVRDAANKTLVVLGRDSF